MTSQAKNSQKKMSRKEQEQKNEECRDKNAEMRLLMLFQGNPELSGRTTSKYFGVLESYPNGKTPVWTEATRDQYLWNEPPHGLPFELRTKRKGNQVPWEQVRPYELFPQLDFCVRVVTRFGSNQWNRFCGESENSFYSTTVHYVVARQEYCLLPECQKEDDEGNFVFVPGSFYSGLYDLNRLFCHSKNEFTVYDSDYTPFYDFRVELVPMTDVPQGVNVLTEEEYCLLKEDDFPEKQTFSREEAMRNNDLFWNTF
jgi:hypothetical protein